jgi:hypothetical protein
MALNADDPGLGDQARANARDVGLARPLAAQQSDGARAAAMVQCSKAGF